MARSGSPGHMHQRFSGLSIGQSSASSGPERPPAMAKDAVAVAVREHTPPPSPREEIAGEPPHDADAASRPPAATSEEVVAPVFVRALHDFVPLDAETGDADNDKSRCITLERGMILVLHELHESGWADGTILYPALDDANLRGWFPANYCENYLPPILYALCDATEAVVRAGNDAARVANMVNAVRQLLRAMHCLERDSAIVQTNPALATERKALLLELSAMLNASRQQALNIVKRAQRVYVRAQNVVELAGPMVDISEEVMVGDTAAGVDGSRPEHNGVDMARETTSSSQRSASNMASVVLSQANETLLSHLAAYIGNLHLQTREPAELYRTTKHAALVATQLINIIDRIYIRYRDPAVARSRNKSRQAVTNLTDTAKSFLPRHSTTVTNTPAQDDMSTRLVEATSACVRTIGASMTFVRQSLEEHGDFDMQLDSRIDYSRAQDKELPPQPDGRRTSVASQARSVASSQSSVARENKSAGDDNASREEAKDEEAEPGPRYVQEIVYNAEHGISAATLYSLICVMADSSQPPEPTFVATFFTTFRMFCKPTEVVEHLVYRFSDPEITRLESKTTVLQPIRLRVFNTFKSWLETYWMASQDETALPLIVDFAAGTLQNVLPTAGKKLSELCTRVASKREPLAPHTRVNHGAETPTGALSLGAEAASAPLVTKNQLLQLRLSLSGQGSAAALTILDFDPLEIARQIAIKEMRIFSKITEEEMLHQKSRKRRSSTSGVRAMSSLSTDMTSWIATSILNEADTKRRTAVVKRWIKVADHCYQVRNYNALMAILCALNSSTIARLRRTWALLANKHKVTLDRLRACTDHNRNYAVYRQLLRRSALPCLPFVGLYLTDLVFVEEGILSFKPSRSADAGVRLVNWEKWAKTYGILAGFRRYQSVPYNFQPVEEVQAWLDSQMMHVHRSGQNLVVGDLWRRSVLLEPKEGDGAPGSSAGGGLGLGAEPLAGLFRKGMQRRFSQHTNVSDSSGGPGSRSASRTS